MPDARQHVRQVVAVRLTPEERDLIDAAAALLGETRTHFIRRAALALAAEGTGGTGAAHVAAQEMHEARKFDARHKADRGHTGQRFTGWGWVDQ